MIAELTERQENRPSVLRHGTAGLLLLLFTICAAPRIVMAIRMDTICTDGAFYIEQARAVSLGTRTDAVGKYDLNVYPLVLSYLHRMGLNWETAAEFWGVLCASLTVLPLFGWMRRQFNLRLATVGCVLYAFHPKLIEWSPEVLRESTFWLLFTTSIYLLYRATTEVRLIWFLAAGITTTLAIHTRFEGWFLLLPAAIWGLSKWRSLERGRMKLALGSGVLGLSYPLTMMFLTLAFGYSHWQWGAFHRVEFAITHLLDEISEPNSEPRPEEPATVAKTVEFVATSSADALPLAPQNSSPVESSAAVAEVPAVEQLPGNDSPASNHWRVASVVAVTMVRGFTYWQLALVAIGAVVGWRRWLRADYLGLILLSAMIIGGIAIHVLGAYLASSRYVLSIVLVTLPLAAFGLLSLCHWLIHGPRPGRIVPGSRQRAVRLALAVFALVGSIDAFSSTDQGREAKAALGDWLRAEYGPGVGIAGCGSWNLVGYYAQSSQTYFLPDYSCVGRSTPGELFNAVLASRPSVLLISPRWSPQAREDFLGRSRAEGYQEVPAERLPKICRGRVIVLSRNTPLRTVQIPAAAGGR